MANKIKIVIPNFMIPHIGPGGFLFTKMHITKDLAYEDSLKLFAGILDDLTPRPTLQANLKWKDRELGHQTQVFKII